ncbi:hypothetical protein Taro_045017 [Colocasia esculenta]|uniref:Uncharacterized protein n=1 Tax=Colocasia esculenta TaxID=4460 RepID=A0A843X446_COLES|nr:hypothetical protein [Colocasia esculenta]
MEKVKEELKGKTEDLTRFVKGKQNLDVVLGVKTNVTRHGLGFQPETQKKLGEKLITYFVNSSPSTSKQAPTKSKNAQAKELEQEKNSEVKRAQLGVVPGWVTFLGSLPTGTVVGPVCWLGRHKWYQSLTQPEVQELSATQDKVLRYGSHLLKP